MKEKQRIQVSGRHWDDIIKLPCFRALVRNGMGGLSLYANVRWADGEREVMMDDDAVLVNPGDWLVKYDNGKWGVERGKGTGE